MFFAMCLGGEVIIIAIIALILLVVLAGICLWLAVLATIGLAKWAAARHLKRLAANAR
ncbi:MAG TPA: hypothetical protein VF591_27620 [Pyrinomonadaceae bacterium]|jgi:hypothetical protein